MSNEPKIKLRKYQELITSEVIEKFKKNERVLVALGMGGGKSLIISEITRKYFNNNKNVVILTNLTELIPQLKTHLLNFGLKITIIKNGEPYIIDANQKNHIYLIMEQSFHENFRLENLNIKCDILIKDEYHIGVSGKRFNEILNHLKPDNILGLSGTPFDRNGFLIEGITSDNLILHGSTKELTNKGYLTPLKYFVPHWAAMVDYSNIDKSGDYSSEDIDLKINNFNHTNLIVKSIIEMMGLSKKTLVYCNSIEHCNRVNSVLLENGFKSVVITSKNDKLINEENLKKFDLNISDPNSINCIVSVSKLTTGFNKPQAELLVLCRPTKILSLYLQIIFRVARLHPGKKNGIILDLAQCVSRHGFGTDDRLYISSHSKTLSDKREKTIEENTKSRINLLATQQLSLKNNNQPIELTKKKLEVELKELRIKSLDIKKTITKDLINYFKSTIDIELIISISFELNYRINHKIYSDTELIRTIEENNYDFASMDNKEKNIFLRDLKKYYQNKIKEKK